MSGHLRLLGGGIGWDGVQGSLAGAGDIRFLDLGGSYPDVDKMKIQ